MDDIPESDARNLLRGPLVCQDVPDWKYGVTELNCTLEGGLIDSMGLATELYVSLKYRRRGKSRLVSYTFSVLRRNRKEVERVYQLTINRTGKPIKDKHRQPHEHIGASRRNGCPEWQEWSYDQVLAYFCAQTNITFVPTPVNPDASR